MKFKTLAVLGLMGSALFAAGPKPVTVMMKDAQGKAVGTVKISATANGVKIVGNLMGLPPGEHAFHIHGVAKCEAPMFTSAGGHFNPEMKHHGKDNPMDPKPHDGDMMNFTVGPKGTAKINVVNTAVTMTDSPNSVFAGGGTALMIHAKGDDYKSDPAGAAGDRIACGTITK